MGSPLKGIPITIRIRFCLIYSEQLSPTSHLRFSCSENVFERNLTCAEGELNACIVITGILKLPNRCLCHVFLLIRFRYLFVLSDLRKISTMLYHQCIGFRFVILLCLEWYIHCIAIHCTPTAGAFHRANPRDHFG